MKLRTVAYIFLAALLLFTIWFYYKHPLTTTVQIHGTKFTAEIAVTSHEKELGLGNRDSLLEKHGMLFPYDHTEQFSYWMKGMRFPIDILWILDNTVVDITKNTPVATSGFLPVYSAKIPINKVFEINAGEADRFGIQIGDLVVIDN